MLPLTTLDLVRQAVPSLPAVLAAMPTKNGYVPAAANVQAFGLSGEHGSRRFQSSLDIAAATPGSVAGALPVTAMFDGQVSWIGKNVAIDPPRPDGSVFLTRRAGLLLKVHPRSAIGRLTQDRLDDPLEYPFPMWVLYEGVEPDPAIDAQLERFASADFFLFDSADLPAAAHALLDDLVLSLEADPGLRVHLTGYADAEGDAARNLFLGTQRAEAVRAYLVGVGIDDDRIDNETQGEERLKLPDAPDRDAAGINRRVEIELRPADVGYVLAGADIGTASERVSITVFDPLGYFIDPLYVVLRLRPDLVSHPLAAYLDPLSPLIASSVVHVVSADPGTDAAADGAPDIIFHDAVDIAVLNAELNDVVWVDLPEAVLNVIVPRSVAVVGKPQAGGAPPLLVPQNDDESIIGMHALPDEPQHDGLRLVGLEFRNGRAEAGAAVRVRDARNIYVGRCTFTGNSAGARAGNGGALHLLRCRNVLVASCRFHLNAAERGGAIYAERCRNVVVNGVPPAGLHVLLGSDQDLGQVVPPPAALTEQAFSSVFVENSAKNGGGAIGFLNCSFSLRNTFFAGNGAVNVAHPNIGYGGAVGVKIETGEFQQIESSIQRCVATGNHAGFGGAFALVGSFDDAAGINGNANSLVGGGRVHLAETVVHGNSADQMGGGVHVVTGRHRIIGNLISGNEGTRNGGGVSFLGDTDTLLADNRILRNLVSGHDSNRAHMNQPLPPNGIGGGGAGLYVSFWVSPVNPRLTLERNRIIDNVSFETGGGMRATCGAQVTLKEGNLFEGNVAYLHGGAVALNSATLIVESDNRFVGNMTQDGRTAAEPERFRGGHGGAIYCYGGRVAAAGFDDTLYATCAADGALLGITGTDAAPVIFSGNRAAFNGGAIYIERQDDMSNIVSRRAAGGIRRARFTDNRATAAIVAGLQNYAGSVIAVLHLDTPPEVPVAFALADCHVEIAQGIGLYAVDSTTSLARTNVTYAQVPGAGVPLLDEHLE